MDGWRQRVLDKQIAFMKRLSFYLKGDRDAMRFCADIIFVGHLWDDLVDRDKVRTPDELDKAFQIMLGEIPTNPFYQANIAQLSGLMMSAILLWRDANVLETGNEDERLASFIARNAMISIVHYCLFLVGGLQWAEEQGPNFWREICPGLNDQYLYFLKEVSNV